MRPAMAGLSLSTRAEHPRAIELAGGCENRSTDSQMRPRFITV